MSYSFIDVDTHITEPPDLWTSRVPASMVDKVPHVARTETGKLAWFIGQDANPLADIGTTAVAGIEGGINNQPEEYEVMHPAAMSAPERLKYMDQVGIWAMVLYPNVGGFGAQNFRKLQDKQLMLACVQAYNDWQTEWTSADPRRLLANVTIPIWDVEASVKEIRRCHRMGHKGILFTDNPESMGYPYFGDAHWNPLWEVATELEMPISFHVASGDIEEELTQRLPVEGYLPCFTAGSVQFSLRNAEKLCSLIMSGVLARYPALKFISVECGVGWIPFVLEALDYQFTQNQVSKYHRHFDMLPSDYFRRNIYGCFWFEQLSPYVDNLVNKKLIDNILFETDFPHPTCLYAEDIWNRVAVGLKGCSDEICKKVLFENALNLYKVERPTAEDENRLKKVISEARPFWRVA